MASSGRLAYRGGVHRVVAPRINAKGAQRCTSQRSSPARCARPTRSQFWDTVVQVTASKFDASPAAIKFLDAAHVQEIQALQELQEKTELQVALKQMEVDTLKNALDGKKAEVAYMNGVLNGRGLIERLEKRAQFFTIPQERQSRAKKWDNLADTNLSLALEKCCKEQQTVGTLIQRSYQYLFDKIHNYDGIEKVPGAEYALPVSSRLPVSVQCALQVLLELEYGSTVQLLVRGDGEPDELPKVDVDGAD